ncbi:hypothetical protein GJ744_005464, partial [Endocarpon pusillum]
ITGHFFVVVVSSPSRGSTSSRVGTKRQFYELICGIVANYLPLTSVSTLLLLLSFSSSRGLSSSNPDRSSSNTSNEHCVSLIP